MSEFLDYDADRGVTHWFDYDDEKGEARITYTQDLEPLLRQTKEFANTGKKDGGIKNSWWLYAKIPALWIVKLRTMGMDLSTEDGMKRAIQYINEHAPWLKTTAKMHEGFAPKIYLPPDAKR